MPSSQTYLNLEYARAGDQSLRLDACIPGGSGPFPAAVVVHGGGWVAGDRRRNVEPLLPALTSAGFAWFSISYTLARDLSQLGAAVDDVDRALGFVLQRAGEFRVDPGALVLVGESAGGQLAAMATLRPESRQVKAVVAFYTPFDLDHLIASSPYGGFLTPALTDRLRNLSPARFIRAGMPPFLLIHGTNDPVVPFEHSKAMCRAIRAAGSECDLISVNGGGHGLRRWESDGSTGYKRLMADWLSRHVAAKNPDSAAPAAPGKF